LKRIFSTLNETALGNKLTNLRMTLASVDYEKTEALRGGRVFVRNSRASSSLTAFLSILLISLVAVAGVGVVHASTAVATVQVVGNPTNLVYDSGRGEVFLLYYEDSGAGGVQSINASNNTAGGSVLLGSVSSLAYDSAKGEVFVSLGGQNMVAIVNDTTLAVKDVSVGQNPGGIAYDSGAGEVFVANYGSNTVSVISDSSNTVVANISVAASPLAVVYDSAKGEVFVLSHNSTGSLGSLLSVISDSSNKVVATTSLGIGAGTMAYDYGKGEIFVQSVESIQVISDSGNQVVASIPLGTGDEYAMTYDSGRSLILFTDDHGLDAISDSSNSIVALGVAAAGSAPWGVTYDPAMNEVFVANYGPNAVEQYTVTVLSDVSLVTSPATTTSTAPPTTSATSIVTTTPPATSTSSSKSGGGIPEFPAELGITLLATAVIVMSYVVARRGLRIGKQSPV
jgi:YVTN family beta-propeller protein